MKAARSSSRDAEFHLDPHRKAVLGCMRAIAAGRRVARLLSEAASEFPKRLSRRDYMILRGRSDAMGLRAACHDTALHCRMRPRDRGDGAIFDRAEQARVEIIGARAMPGTAANLSAMLYDRYLKPEFASLETRAEAPIADAVALLIRQRFMPPSPVDFASLRVVQVWGSFIEREAGGLLDSLSDVLTDQAAFSSGMLRVIAALGDRERPDPGTVSAAPEEELDAESEKEPGPIEGGDRFLGAAEGIKSAEEDAIGEEPIFGEAERAKAPGDDLLAERADPGKEELSEPSRRHRKDGARVEETYHAFTTAFDEIVVPDEIISADQLASLRQEIDQQAGELATLVARLANNMQRALMAKQSRYWDRHLEQGVLDVSRLPQVIADPAATHIYMEEKDGPFRDTVVTLLLDNSGSMRGRPSVVVAACADILARTLERCGVRIEILGFTTRTWRGGKAREAWIGAGCPAHPGRLNELRHIIYKTADAPWRRTRNNLGLLMLNGLHKENVDGEALLWAHGRLARRPERRKILMMISDGAPSDDATLAVASGAGNYLERHLSRIVAEIDGAGLVELFAIGIGYDVGRLYPRSLTIKDVDELGPVLVGQLSALLDRERPRPARSHRAGT